MRTIFTIDKFKGLVFLSLTIICWVGSATLIKLIFTAVEFDKPFFVTYVSDSLNFLYLLVFLKRFLYRNSKPEGNEQGAPNNNFIKLAIIFAPLLMIANYLYNEGLTLTTIASSCILSNTSSIFIFLLSIPILGHRFSVIKLLCVLVSFGGACLIGISDNDASSNNNRHALVGDIISLISAMIYAVYATTLKKYVPDDSKFSWAGFFATLGICVTIIFIPFFYFLDLLGIEEFAWPPFSTFLLLLLNGVCGTVFPDYFWARSVVLLDPLISDLGIGLTIPIGMVIDYFVEGKRYTFYYVLGAAYIMGGFILITLYDFKAARSEKDAENKLIAEQNEGIKLMETIN